MIQSFKDKETKKIWQLKLSKKIPGAIQQRALNKLNLIDQASKVEDPRIPPSNHLKALAGKRKNQFSIRINDQYRICFEWNNGAEEVEICDYH
mgnify:FL=1